MYLEEQIEFLKKELAATNAKIEDGFKQLAAMLSNKNPERMTRKEVASALRCSVVTVDKYFNDRLLTRIKDGKHTYALREEVESLLTTGVKAKKEALKTSNEQEGSEQRGKRFAIPHFPNRRIRGRKQNDTKAAKAA